MLASSRAAPKLRTAWASTEPASPPRLQQPPRFLPAQRIAVQGQQGSSAEAPLPSGINGQGITVGVPAGDDDGDISAVDSQLAQRLRSALASAQQQQQAVSESEDEQPSMARPGHSTPQQTAQAPGWFDLAALAQAMVQLGILPPSTAAATPPATPSSVAGQEVCTCSVACFLRPPSQT
jgi:hypothetical protein